MIGIWSEYYVGARKSGENATNEDLVNAYLSTYCGLNVIASASRPEPRFDGAISRLLVSSRPCLSPWAVQQLAEVRAYYKALEAKKELITPGAKVDLGEGLQLSNGMEVRWFEVYRRETAGGRRGPLCLYVPKVGTVRGLGRDWVKRVQRVIPAGAAEPVVV